MRHRTSSKAALSLLLASIIAVLLTVSTFALTASASSTASIEGAWKFNGGKVVIEPGSEGLVGIVVEPTKFAQCTHKDGEEIWTHMTRQSNGSYWGLHQWFYENAECTPNHNLGPTAWRVMETATGGHYLLVCFSSPEKPEQPIIEPGGESKDVSYGCVGSEVESGHVASLSEIDSTSTANSAAQSFRGAVTLPSNKKCYSLRTFKIHVRDPANDAIKEVVVTLRKRRIVVKRQGNVFVATIDLKDLPQGTFTIRIAVTTVLGRHLDGSRTYHTCARRRKSSKPKSLTSAGGRRS